MSYIRNNNIINNSNEFRVFLLVYNIYLLKIKIKKNLHSVEPYNKLCLYIKHIISHSSIFIRQLL